MDLTLQNKKLCKPLMLRSLAKYLLFLISSITIIYLTKSFWEPNIIIFHIIFEGLSIFFALGIFSLCWHNAVHYPVKICTLGFGFLLIAVYNSVHAYYLIPPMIFGSTPLNLSIALGQFGLLMQVSVTLLSTFNLKIKPNKFTHLFILGVTLLIIILIYTILPYMIKSITPYILSSYFTVSIKITVIFLAIFALIRLKNMLQIKCELDYQFIFLSLLAIITVEFFCLILGNLSGYLLIFTHTLKAMSYYFMYKGVFASAVVYPYDNLEHKHKELEEAYESLTQANKEITNLSQTLSDVLDSLPLGVFMYDENSKINYLNKKFEEIFMCDKSQALGLSTGEFLNKFPRLEADEKLLSDRVLSGDSSSLNLIRTYRMGNGEYKKLSIKNTRINNGVISLIKDAKEEQEIKNLHLQTETILNAVNNAIIMIDKEKKVVLCNKAAEKIFEIDKSDLLGMDIDELNDLLMFERKDNPSLILSGEKACDICEATLKTAKGNTVDLIIYSAPIRNIDGEIIGGISVDTDVTEMKKQQHAMQQQEKLALLGQMGAGIVHETRNFLTTIKGRCQLIDVNTEDRKIKEYASKINKDVDEVNRIIGEFLFLSKPRKVLLEEISMVDLFEAIVNTIENTSITKGIDLSLDISKEERYLLCDEVQIKQVVLNICKNAVEAMDGTQFRKLKIITGYIEESNEMYIKIIDNGKGMSKKQLEKLGTMFYTTKETGTGLGLNVCYQIIKSHKGQILVESVLEEGTSFTIILPCLNDEDLDE